MSKINLLNLDDLPEPLEVLDIVGEKAGNIISQHGRHNIGIMDFLPTDFEIFHQLDKLSGHLSGIVRHPTP